MGTRDENYAKIGHIPNGGLTLEAGDVSYSEISTTADYFHIPTKMSHIAAGFAFPDSTVRDTLMGRASPRIGEISAGQICFSMSDTTITVETITYIAVGW